MARRLKRGTSSGHGMPSAHGSEWKGDNVAEARRKFDENYDKIDWTDNGKARTENGRGHSSADQ